MTARIRKASLGAMLASAVAAWPAVGQTGRPWVDPPIAAQPPASSPTPEQPAPGPDPSASAPSPAAPPPGPTARPAEATSSPAGPHMPGVTEGASVEKAARQLAIDYLDFWSAPNALALETMPGFYGPAVEFHGREISARALLEKKRRFVRRWPVRAYTPRLDTMWTACDRSGELCTVRTAFDFTAINPERRRRSQGTGDLELQVSFAGDRPVIVSEASRVRARGRLRRTASFSDAED